jgi:hypothetical protein
VTSYLKFIGNIAGNPSGEILGFVFLALGSPHYSGASVGFER